MFLAPFLLQAVRIAATRVIQRAAISRVAAGGAPPFWARAGFGSARATEAVSTRMPGVSAGGGRGLTPHFRRAFGDPNTGYFQPLRALGVNTTAPTVPLSQRVAAQSGFGAKAGEVGRGIGMSVVRNADRAITPGLVGGLEFAGWNFALGQMRGEDGQLPRPSLPQGPDIPFGGAQRAPMPDAFEPSVPPVRRGPQPGPYGPGIDPDWRPPVGAGPERSPAPTRPPGADGAENFLIDGPRARSGQTPPPAFSPDLVGPSLTQEDAQIRFDFEDQMASLNAGYQNMIGQIRSMYQLSETEEEKELLRFQLADLEEQYEAGREAITTLFAEKTQTLQALASTSRGRAIEAGQAAQGVYQDAALELEALREARNAAQVESNRGLGIGSSRPTAFDGLLQTMAPIAGQYAQRIGDISAEGLEYLGGLTESLGAARQGELQSLYAGTRSTMMSEHASQVAARIAAERLAKASALQSVMSQQLAAQSRLAGQADSAPTPVDYWNTAEALAQVPGMTPEAFSQEFFRRFGVLPDEHIMNHFMRWNDDYNRRNAPTQQESMDEGLAALMEGLRSGEITID